MEDHAGINEDGGPGEGVLGHNNEKGEYAEIDQVFDGGAGARVSHIFRNPPDVEDEGRHDEQVLDADKHIFAIDAEGVALEPVVDDGDPVGDGLEHNALVGYAEDGPVEEDLEQLGDFDDGPTCHHAVAQQLAECLRG